MDMGLYLARLYSNNVEKTWDKILSREFPDINIAAIYALEKPPNEVGVLFKSTSEVAVLRYLSEGLLLIEEISRFSLSHLLAPYFIDVGEFIRDNPLLILMNLKADYSQIRTAYYALLDLPPKDYCAINFVACALETPEYPLLISLLSKNHESARNYVDSFVMSTGCTSEFKMSKALKFKICDLRAFRQYVLKRFQSTL